MGERHLGDFLMAIYTSEYFYVNTGSSGVNIMYGQLNKQQVQRIILFLCVMILLACGGEHNICDNGFINLRQTTGVTPVINLNSAATAPASIGSQIMTQGVDIGVSQVGISVATTTTLVGSSFASGISPAFPISFDVTLSGASSGNGTVSVRLDTPTVPATISNLNALQTLASAINAQLLLPALPATPIDVVVTAIDDGGGNFHLEFTALESGEASQIDITNVSTALNPAAAIGISNSTSFPGIPAVVNGYPAESLDITDPNGHVVTYTSVANAAAATTAAELNALMGVSATATTLATLLSANYNNTLGNMVITLNGVSLTSDTLADLAVEINGLSSSTLPDMRAFLDTTTGNLIITSLVGDDLIFSLSSTTDGDAIEVIGEVATRSQILEVDTGGGFMIIGASDASNHSIVVGGTIDIIFDADYNVANASTANTNLFGLLTPTAFTSIVINSFDPSDKSTYNYVVEADIFDSLGNVHVLTQYFVKQKFDPDDPRTAPNHWLMYVLVDGEDVGDPDTTLPPPQNALVTRASYDLHFNADGSLNALLTDDILISNWTPLDNNGNENGALGPLNVLQGGSTDISDPPASSNFVIDASQITQIGMEFLEFDIQQNGSTLQRCE